MDFSNLQYFLLVTTTLLIGLLFFILVRIKNKSQMHYSFISFVSLIIIWNFGVILEKLWSMFYGYTNMIFVNLAFIGTCFIPVSFLFAGLIFSKTKIKIKKSYILSLIVPIISTIVLWTNEYHHLFFVKYSFISSEVVYGSYFIFHAVYSYTCVMIGMYCLVYFSIKNAGIFSKQSILILVGTFVPLIVNIIFTLKIFVVTQFATPMTFSFAIICYFIAIVKYDFLGVLPIVLQTAVDRISDGFIVIDLEYRIVDFNKTLLDTFNNVVEFKRKVNILKLLEHFKSIDIGLLKSYFENVAESRTSIIFERHFMENGFNKYFTIEITPIMSKETYLGTIILLKDITQQKENQRTINEQQKQIIEQERLASLGNLMGGISHNLKTPIMSISGCAIALEDLANEYKDSIGNPIVNEYDHREIADEMLNHIKDLNGHISYISNALTAIKNQVVDQEGTKQVCFSLDEVILNVEFLMKYEIKSNFCSMVINNEANKDCLINGAIGTLVQVINNLISNAIQSYEKIDDVNNIDVNKRKIELKIYEEESYLIFRVKDYGGGVPQEIKDRLFKEMVTTKGKDGSGIGLYLSYSKIKVMFNGDMWLESEEGKGSSFYIKVQLFKI